MTYNRYFELDLEDLEIIESALRQQLSATDSPDRKRLLNDMLGKLHQQKTWYRPKGKEPYISG